MTDTGTTERCKNCITRLPEGARFCPHCGQRTTDRHDQSIWHLVIESVGDFFHFESKFFSTLRLLLFRPGFLTTEYLAGRRIRYFEPFKLFLLISFLFFLISGILSNRGEGDGGEATPALVATDTANRENNDGRLHLTLGNEFDVIIDMPDDSLKKLVKKEGLNKFVNKKAPGASWWAKFMLKQVIKDRLDLSEGFNQNWKKTIPKLIFLLIPIFALLLKMLYMRRKILYFNHVIFSFHFLSFFFLVSILNEFLKLITSLIGPVIFLLVMVYLFLSLRRVYRDKPGTTIWKFTVFLFGSVFVLLIFLFLAATISFIMI